MQLYSCLYPRYIVTKSESIQYEIRAFEATLPRYRNISGNKEHHFRVVPEFSKRTLYTNPLKFFHTLAKHHGIILLVSKTRAFQPFLHDGATNYRMETVQCSIISEDKVDAYKYYWSTQFHHSTTAYNLMEYVQISGIQTLITNLRQEKLFYKLLPQQNKNATIALGEDSEPVVRRTREDILGVRKPQKMPLFESNLQNLFILYLGMLGSSIIVFVGENKKSEGVYRQCKNRLDRFHKDASDRF